MRACYRGCLALVLSGLLMAGTANACSYDGLAVDLSLAHPASLGVSLALQQAYLNKHLARPLPLPGGFGMRRTLHQLESLRSHPALGAEDFSLLLVEPGLWVRFSAQGVTLHAPPPGPGEAVVVTGEGVLLALRNGKLDVHQALRDGLLHIEGNTRDAVVASWLKAYPQTTQASID
ncbi:SCP2 sterol-binding domain-containing protein [Pseudomonas sp. GOM6]|uniref:SCP2 sterol-binding domain-containing protein n=1 Tax=Pseudomonas sp. GOM6 TaxID=3036944 RepID=UPI0024099782|nr:SCP2 sterol-binding domain-containing protein [Pseudomonas sp. GOM6]MDG1581779.1 hypothetical protein [Pseudomonas sp. GOM6]